MKCKIIVCSDRCSSGQSTDKSGPALEEMVKNQLEILETEIKIVPDEIELIKSELISATENNFSLILTSGGTGFAPRDVTPEATRAVIGKFPTYCRISASRYSVYFKKGNDKILSNSAK